MKRHCILVVSSTLFGLGCATQPAPRAPRHGEPSAAAIPSPKTERGPLGGQRARLFVARFLLDLEVESPKILGRLEPNAEFRTSDSERRQRLAFALDRSFKKDASGKNRRLRFDFAELRAIEGAGGPLEYFDRAPILAFSAPYRVETSGGSSKAGLLEIGIVDRGDQLAVVYLENERGELE